MNISLQIIQARGLLYDRDGHTCVYCGRHKNNGAKLSLDHIEPYGISNDNTMFNLVTCCKPCNSVKSTRILSDDEYQKIKKEVRKRSLRFDEHTIAFINMVMDTYFSKQKEKKNVYIAFIGEEVEAFRNLPVIIRKYPCLTYHPVYDAINRSGEYSNGVIRIVKTKIK